MITNLLFFKNGNPAKFLFVLLLLLTSACATGNDHTGNTGNAAISATVEPFVEEGSVKVGAPAPPFRFSATNGTVVALKELKGKVVVINFWATWCAPCRLEMPALEAAYQANQAKGLQLIAIESRASGSQEESAKFLKEVGVTFPNVRDESGIMEKRYIKRPAWPTTIFIDREGIVRHVQIGPMTEEFIEEQLHELGF